MGKYIPRSSVLGLKFYWNFMDCLWHPTGINNQNIWCQVFSSLPPTDLRYLKFRFSGNSMGLGSKWENMSCQFS